MPASYNPYFIIYTFYVQQLALYTSIIYNVIQSKNRVNTTQHNRLNINISFLSV